ncbi:MAG: aldehyde dehydrogenase family protein [Candidatus Sulfotelmatobacter sp.]
MGIASVNPATGEKLKEFEPYPDAEVDGRLARAAHAFAAYRKTSFARRADWMIKAGDISPLLK